MDSSTLWTRPLYGLDNKLVHFKDLINSSTLWARPLYELDNKFVHFMDLIINLSTLWT